MSSKTLFGLEVLAPGDPLSSDGYAFGALNPVITGKLLKVGAVTHRHDAHAALTDPTLAPALGTSSTGGTIDSDTIVFFTYTLLDADNGESAPVDALSVTTAGGYADPTGAPTTVVSFAAGALLADTYLYGVTVTDGLGGETALGPTASVQVPASAHAEVFLSGLTAITDAASGTSTTAGWRLWRSTDGGNTFDLMATGPHGTDTFTDDGSSVGDCTVSPPETGSTGNTASVTVTVPAGQPADAAFFNIYMDTEGIFATPALVGTYPIGDAGVPVVISDLGSVNDGSPPATSNCVGGANQIDPDTDILNYPWKRPAANSAALPALGNTDGDMREALDAHQIYCWDAGTSAWVPNGVGPVGPTGATGARTEWWFGAGNPGTVVGANTGDLYLNSTTGEIWRSASGASSWVNTGTSIKGPTGPQGASATSVVTVNTQTPAASTSYHLALGDAGGVVEVDGSAGSVTVTIDPNATTDQALNTVIEICDMGSSPIQIVAGAGVTLEPPPGSGGSTSAVTSSGRWATIGLRQRAIDQWVVSGRVA